MNPLTIMRNQNLMNQRELDQGIAGTSKTWHREYSGSAWVYVGGLPYDLTEGDVICIFSQYGEIVNINMVRDKDSGKSKGFGFICYEDQRSTNLAVDNFNGAQVLGRSLRVDHVSDYRQPKDHGGEDEMTMSLREQGCAPKLPSSSSEEEEEEMPLLPVKHHKQKKKKHKKPKRRTRESSVSEDDSDRERKHSKSKQRKTADVKKERDDPGYSKYANNGTDYDRHEDSGRPIKQEHRTNRERESDESDREYEQRHRYGQGDHSRSRGDYDRYNVKNENGRRSNRDRRERSRSQESDRRHSTSHQHREREAYSSKDRSRVRH